MATATMKAKNGTTGIESVEDLVAAGFKRLGNPRVFKLRDMNVGDSLVVTIKSLSPSKNKSIRQPLIEAKRQDTGEDVSIPAQASIANQLIDEKTGKLLHVGKTVAIVKTGERQSSKYKDDNGQPRTFAVYDVLVK